MRGGYRVGSGPKKGAKYKKRSLKTIPESELTPEQKEQIRLLLSFGERTKDGGTLTRTELKQLEEIGKSLDKQLRKAEKNLMEILKKAPE